MKLAEELHWMTAYIHSQSLQVNDLNVYSFDRADVVDVDYLKPWLRSLIPTSNFNNASISFLL